MTLRWSEIVKFSKALQELYAEAELHQFPERQIAAIQTLIQADVHIYNEYSQDRIVIRETPNAFTPALSEAFVAHMHENLLVHAALEKPLPAGRISDYMTHREWRETTVYQESFGQLGLHYQMGGRPDTGEVVTTYSSCRTGKDFSDEECALLALFSGHFVQARQNAVLHSRVMELEARLTEEAARAAVVRFDHSGSVSWASVGGLRLLSTYFPGTPSNRVPGELLAWARSEADRFAAGALAVQPSCVRNVSRPGRTLQVRLCPLLHGGAFEIRMDETVEESPEQLKKFGLTQRESEVLFWISRGKRTPEIALILDMAPKTVSKHTERIFVKMGVETRSAAAAMALEAMNLNDRP